MKPTILLCISINHGISKLITENLEFHGFEVIQLSPFSGKEEKFKYPSLLSRLHVKFKKIFLRDNDSKLKLQSKILRQDLEKILKNTKIDYSLFFLAQNYSLELIEYIRELTPAGNMINYQWDGMDRYPKIYERLKYFDKFYAFDPKDIDNMKGIILPTTSFYFDHNLPQVAITNELYFLGSHIENRSDKIKEFGYFSKRNGIKINFQILCHKNYEYVRNYYPDNITVINSNEVKTYEENLILSRKSKVLVDFVDCVHNGLSLRTFEAIGYDKKLITTNKEVIKYDFYHPNNIFILEDNYDEIIESLEKPFIEIDLKTKEKYSFKNWIKYILNLPDHQPILLPPYEKNQRKS